MRIAIPIADGRLIQHFGHCEKFALVDVDPVTKETTASTEVAAPEHQPGRIYMAGIYAKSRRETLSAADRNVLARLAAQIKKAAKGGR